ncbi:MAG: C25 family cysteine peptidase [Ignavibacteriaceae bacterium]
MKYFLFVLFGLVICLDNLHGQQSHITKVQGNSFVVTIDSSYCNFTDSTKGKFTIRDYYNFANPSSPGTYMLPYKDIILAIPPYSHPNIQVVNKQETILNDYVPAANPLPSLTNDSTIALKNIGYKNIENYKPQNIVQIEGYFWFRDFYCVHLRINNYYFDQNNSSIVEYKNLQLSLSFSQPLSSSSPIKVRSQYDNQLKNLIYDADIAEQFKANPKLIMDDSTDNWINYNSTYVKLGVVNDGLFRIYKSDLTNLGVDVSGINPKTFQLFLYGKEIPVFVKDENSGVFSDSDYIEFFGTRNYPSISYRTINSPDQNYNEYLNRYTDTSIYFLTWGNQNGIRSSIDSTFITSISDTLKYCTQLLHNEKNIMAQNLYDDEVENQSPGWVRNRSWYWSWLFVGQASYSFQVPNLYPNEPANFYFKLVSAGSSVSTNSHNVILSVNNTALDSEVVNRYQQVLLHGTVNSNNLLSGTNQLSVRNYDNGTSPNYLATDWYDIEYPAYLTMQNDSLYFKVSDDVTRKVRVIQINNVSDPDLIIYKVKPGFTRKLNFIISSGNLFFTDTVGAGDTYEVISPSKILRPVFYYKKKFVDLRNSNNQADYIAITHPDFLQVASNYVQKISSMYSVNAKLINVQDIYDEFGFGFPTPESIKLFLESAFQYWQSPKPSYLTIIGDADYDYKHYLFLNNGTIGGGNYVPSYGDPVSDNWFVVWGDSSIAIPQMMVGRIPINNSSDLNYYLNKVVNNYNSPYDEFNKRYLLFSGGDATSQSEIDQLKTVNDSIITELLEPKPIAGEYSHFYKTINPPTNFGPYTPGQVQSAISNGGVFISYIGHSGTATWDNSINETTQLENNVGKNSLMTDFGCSTNKFAEPDIVCFGERFLLSNTGQAIAYLGNSSLGFLTTATTVPILFYRSLLQDTLHQVGAAHLNAKIQMFDLYGGSEVFNDFSYTNSLLGDPVIEIKIPNKPNLEIGQNDINFQDNSITENDDSTLIKFVVHNFGLAINDILQVKIIHSLPDKSVEIKNLTIRLPDISDTLSVRLNVKSMPGTHSVQIIIDPNDYVDEIYKTDNTAQTTFYVASESLKDLIANKVENSALNFIDVLSPTLNKSINFNIIVQTSLEANFQTYNQFSDSAQPFITHISLSNLIPGNRYWVRYKIDDQNSLFSQPKSFLNSGNYKFYLDDSTSFENQANSNISFSNGNSHLSQDSIKISVISEGYYSGASCSILINGNNILSNTYFAGMGIAVLDQNTFAIDTTAWYNLFNQPANMQQLVNLINSIPNGKIVVMGVADDAANNITAALKTAIKTLGSALIDLLNFRGSWAIIGQKGAAKGSVPEGIEGPYNGLVSIDSIFSVPAIAGRMITNNIGPATKWQSMQVNQNISSDGSIKFRPIGIQADGSSDTLNYLTVINNSADLSFIDSKKYPNLKLEAEMHASSSGISPTINLIGVHYTGLAELGTNYQVVSISSDSVLVGTNENLQFYVYNVGEVPADSFNVLVDVNNPDNSMNKIYETLVDSLNPGSRRLFNIKYTPMSAGNNNFYINIDPDNNIPELYKDNNVFSIPFYVKSDTSAPSLKITFDGNNIIDGDYISNHPKIKIALYDPSNLSITDTSAVSIFLNGNPVYYSNNISSLTYQYNSSNPKYIATYIPTLADGNYTLTVKGKNALGRSVDSTGISRNFVVSSKFNIQEVYNYPNPFSGGTYFTFKLPQMPDELDIFIYTVAGRLIKKIIVYSSQLNYNFNKIYWDGRDEDGDLLANGVYFYQVVIKRAGSTDHVIQKLAIVR